MTTETGPDPQRRAQAGGPRHPGLSGNHAVAFRKISTSGVMEDPTMVTVEKGQRMWTLIIGHLVKFVDQLKTMTLAEIYQRKY